MRPIVFHPKAREEIRRFPADSRAAIGRGLFRLQMGETLAMPLARAMPAVGPGVSELRARGADRIYRVFSFAREREGRPGVSRICEENATHTAPGIELARKRLKELLNG